MIIGLVLLLLYANYWEFKISNKVPTDIIYY